MISITDGQIYLESDLFYAGVRPAINVGLSVSRVGGKAQTKAMRQVAGQLRLDLAQYRELLAFTQFGSQLDKTSQAQLTRGQRMVELLKQAQFEPLTLAQQVVVLYAGSRGFLDSLPIETVRIFGDGLVKFIESKYQDVEFQIETKKELDKSLQERLEQAIKEFKTEFEEKIKA